MKRKNEKGQSTVEFVLVFLPLMAISFFLFQLAAVFGYGNYAHYATFMAARAYLAAGPREDDQVQRAKDVVIRVLKKSVGQSGVDRWAGVAQGVKGSGDPQGAQIGSGALYAPGDPSFSWQLGVRYTFRSRLFMIPLFGSGKSTNSVVLTSESWLGREPTYGECKEEMDRHGWIFDNGC